MTFKGSNDIPYWVSASYLASQMTSVFPLLNVDSWTWGNAYDGYTLNFRIFGYNGNVPDFEIDTTLLVGDVNVSPPTIT